MKLIFTLVTACCLLFSRPAHSQAILNELYTDPGAGKHEFFEIYNTGATTASMDNYTLLCFFDISGTLGWYVMDLPNITVGPKGYFVGSAAIPFNFQGVTGSIMSDFSWNSAIFTLNNGYVRKWIKATANLTDGNAGYDQATLPANFNDFLFRRSASGASYSIFLYKNGLLTNSFIGGTGGSNTIINDIVNMPSLYVDMSGSSPDFTIDFSNYQSLVVESTTQNAGSDNGYIRDADGECGGWVKSSSQIQHTPKASNGVLGFNAGLVSVQSAIARGTLATGSVVNYDIVSAPANLFPIELQVYLDNGITVGSLDAADTYVESNTETIISQGPFYTTFFPFNANILIVVKTTAGCLDKVIFIPNSTLLSVRLVAFNGFQDKKDITLNWTVDENETGDRFEVEKSTDGKNFVAVNTVPFSVKSGRENYIFLEKAPVSGKATYRLKIYDKSGTSSYSGTLVFESSSVFNNPFKVLTNPVQDRLALSFQSESSQPSVVQIMDMNGRMIQQQTIRTSIGTNIISLTFSSSVKKGIYIVDLFDGNNHYTSKFIKQ
jgi:hypothetical protein